MRRRCSIALPMFALVACAGPHAANDPDVGSNAAPSFTAGAETTGGSTGSSATASDSEHAAAKEFEIRHSHSAKSAHSATASKIKPTATEAALKFFVVDKDKGPIEGIVISVQAPNGDKYYTDETDAQGYTELLVPVGQKYDLVYLSLGRRDVAARVAVSADPRQNIRLTMRYKRIDPPSTSTDDSTKPGFVLDGVTFDSGKATIRAESFPRLDSVVEYMTHKKSSRIEIAGYTDSVGNPEVNKALSERRAQACRQYLIKQGINASRIVAMGYGDQHPIASNDTEEGRQQNRRIEATELLP